MYHFGTNEFQNSGGITLRQDFFPDHTPVSDWFYEIPEPKLEDLGTPYCITDYGIADDGNVHTGEFQDLINRVSDNGGGVLVVPKGIYRTGALFFKQGVNLYIEKDGVLMGSDNIADYPLCVTRIEGETCRYFPALVNVDHVDGFTLCGKGTIDGNGQKAWKAFWLRRSWNPNCTNKDEQRPRLFFASYCENLLINGVTLQNSHFWTAHFYKCRYVKVIGARMYSPLKPVAAPSTDAIDIDACTDMLVKNCVVHVNDDAIALKGGKGPDADRCPENGANERIIVEDCKFLFCHSCLTCGSESIHNRNIWMKNTTVMRAFRLFWLKMRPDTPQHYEYITVEGAKGNAGELLNINPWTQFFNLKGQKQIPLSYADHIVLKDCDLDCERFLNVRSEKSQYLLSDFTLQNLNITIQEETDIGDAIENLRMESVSVTKKV